MVRRGEVRWYKFAKPDKRRPVLLLTRDSIMEYLGEVTVAPATTTIREIPSEVPLSKKDGMPKNCVLNLDHVQTVSKGEIGSLITTLQPEKMAEVKGALMFALGY